MLIVLVIFLKFYLLEFDLFVTWLPYFLLLEIALLIKLIVVPAFIKQKAFMLLLNNNIYSELTKKRYLKLERKNSSFILNYIV